MYSAVGGVITYTVPLPSVPAGQRLNFWTCLGIKDGAGIGGETQFQVTVNGNNLFGELPLLMTLWLRFAAVVDCCSSICIFFFNVFLELTMMYQAHTTTSTRTTGCGNVGFRSWLT